jgi:hypothetical protein
MRSARAQVSVALSPTSPTFRLMTRHSLKVSSQPWTSTSRARQTRRQSISQCCLSSLTPLCTSCCTVLCMGIRIFVVCAELDLSQLPASSQGGAAKWGRRSLSRRSLHSARAVRARWLAGDAWPVPQSGLPARLFHLVRAEHDGYVHCPLQSERLLATHRHRTDDVATMTGNSREQTALSNDA